MRKEWPSEMSRLREAQSSILASHFAVVALRHGSLFVMIFALVQVLDPVNSRLLAVTMIYSIATIGLNITLGYCGLVSLAQAGFIGLGAYTWTLSSQRLDIDFVPALLLATGLCVVVGFLVGALATRIKTHYFIIVTIGIQVVFITLLNQLSSLTGGSQGLPVDTNIRIGGLVIADLKALLVVIAVIFVLALFIANRLHSSRDGLAMLAIFESGQAAEASGINARMYRSVGMAIGAGFGGLAGCLFAPYLQFLGPESFGLDLSILLIVMLVVGGLGSNVGAVVGVTVLTQVDHYAQSTLGLSNLFYGLILILAVLLAPNGLTGLARTAMLRAQRRFSRVQNPPSVAAPKLGVDNLAMSAAKRGSK